jgi:hypothetical protein
LARTNYKFEKRQKDLAKQRKREEKLQRKHAKKDGPGGENPELSPDGEPGNLDETGVDPATQPE